MSSSDYFMITVAIYASHEVSPGFRVALGFVSVVIGVAIKYPSI